MTERERKFKIEKRTSYEDTLKEESKNTTKSALVLGLGATITIAAAARFAENPVLYENIDWFLATAVSAGVTALDLKVLIESIMEKTLLKQKIADINDDLKLDDQIKEDEKFDQIIHGGR